MLTIDGTFGEGGGQIVRTALALSTLTGRGVRIRNIRAGRKKGGLKAQHLHCIKMLEQLCGARAAGASPGSSELEFTPGNLRSGEFSVDIGTAGSICLLLQAILLPACFAPGKVVLSIAGGTDTEWSTPFDYFQRVVLPHYRSFAEISCTLQSRGYYPKGGGIVLLEVRPRFPMQRFTDLEEFLHALRQTLPPLSLLRRGVCIRISGVSHAATTLSVRKVVERQAEAAEKILRPLNVPVAIERQYCDTRCPGSGVTLWAECAGAKDPEAFLVLGSDTLGKPRKPAEEVGKECARNLVKTLKTERAVDEHLEDSLIPLLALRTGSMAPGAQSKLPSKHTLSNIYVCSQFLSPEILNVDGKLIAR